MPPDVLGHLMHRLQLQRPQELRVMMSKMSLSHSEQLLLGVACELRPALAERGPAVSVLDCGHRAVIVVAETDFLRPTERVGSSAPDVHAWHDEERPLSIRFQIVAGGR